MRRCLSVMFCAAILFAASQAADPDTGVLPVGADGKPLNLDFETGTLKDWTATGDAFAGQPIRGDAIAARRTDMKSRHQGEFWIGGWEKKDDPATGTLTSVAFKVTHPWATFLVGGGPYPDTCVELVRTDTGEVFSRTSGLAEEDMRRVAVDLRPVMGKKIFIRLVDQQTGHWGHINFDDFRFHAADPKVPPRPAPGEQLVAQLPADEYKYAGLPPEKAAQVDDRAGGLQRLAVRRRAGRAAADRILPRRSWPALGRRGLQLSAETDPMPGKRTQKPHRLIFEDTEGDGTFRQEDRVHGRLEPRQRHGSRLRRHLDRRRPVFRCSSRSMRRRQAGGPAANPARRLGLRRHSRDSEHASSGARTAGSTAATASSRIRSVGKPGTPDKDRMPLNAGIWRYHPTRHVFEVFAEGTSNPWGLDFDEHGQAFIEACVIPHCFHIIQGGRYLRQAGPHFNPYTYADIQTIADHLHWQRRQPVGGQQPLRHARRRPRPLRPDGLPRRRLARAEYRGQLFMGNIHGRRSTWTSSKPKGPATSPSHGPDFLLANDAWARFINLQLWPRRQRLSDRLVRQASLPSRATPTVWDRTNGRIYKISYRGTKPVTGVDLARSRRRNWSSASSTDNEWYVRHARRFLQERSQPCSNGNGQTVPRPPMTRLPPHCCSTSWRRILRGSPSSRVLGCSICTPSDSTI